VQRTPLRTFPIFVLALTFQNGILDPTFGDGGKVGDRLRGRKRGAYALAVSLTAKISLVGGFVGRCHPACLGFALAARYSTNGSIDTTFGTNGKVTTSFGNKTAQQSAPLAVQTDNGSWLPETQVPLISNFALARFLTLVAASMLLSATEQSSYRFRQQQR